MEWNPRNLPNLANLINPFLETPTPIFTLTIILLATLAFIGYMTWASCIPH